MGSGMAGRLLSANFPVTVYNRSHEKAKRLADAGAFVADSPHDAAAKSEIVISMVADDAASRQVWLGDRGSLAGAAAGTWPWLPSASACVPLTEGKLTGRKPEGAGNWW